MLRLSIPQLLPALAIAAIAAGCSESSRLNLRCTAGDIERCEQLGNMYANGDRVPRDLGRATELYRRACDGGMAEVCNRLGEIYESVGGFDVSSRQVGEYYQRACAGNSEMGCFNFGRWLQGEGESERAVELFERACTVGLMPGCHQLALAYEGGDGVAKDVSRAIELYDEACTGDEVDSCLALFTLFTDGEDVPVDVARARTYGTRAIAIRDAACREGSERDCEERSRLQTRVTLALAAATAAAAKR